MPLRRRGGAAIDRRWWGCARWGSRCRISANGTQTEAAVFVACSTLCFSKQPLSEALRAIGELGFNKVDLAVDESGTHLRPSAVAADVARAAQLLRHGPGLAIAAFHIEFADGLSRED